MSDMPTSAGLRVAIMTDETGWHTARLKKAFRARGVDACCIDLPACRIDTTWEPYGLALPGFGHALPDAVFVRGIAGGTFEQVTLRLGILHALRECGVPVYNDARAIERRVDKSMTSFLLHRNGMPTPATWAGRVLVIGGRAGVPVQRGPDEIKDLPQFLGQAARQFDLSRYETEVFAEIVDAPRLDLDGIAARAMALRGRRRRCDRRRLPARYRPRPSSLRASQAIPHRCIRRSIRCSREASRFPQIRFSTRFRLALLHRLRVMSGCANGIRRSRSCSASGTSPN
jgi:RimK PreATP-grasp domain